MERLRSALLPIVFLLAGITTAEGQLELNVETRVRVDAPAGFDVYTWQVPSPLVFEQRGSQILVEGPAGKYRINISALKIDWDTREFKQETGFIDVQIGGGPSPVPDPDDPAPNPEPSPDDKHRFEIAARDWMRTVKPEYLGFAPKIATNFESVASGIRSGDVPSVEAAIKQVQETNQAVLPSGSEEARAWTKFNDSLNQKLSSVWPLNKYELLGVFVALSKVLRE